MTWADLETALNAEPRFYIEPRDKLGLSETDRQAAFVVLCRRSGLHCDAVPNARLWGMKAWNRARKEGVRWGHSDLIITGRGGFTAFAEMKDGDAMPEQHQTDFLNGKVDLGFPSAVIRTAEGGMTWLMACGAPMMERAA